MFIKHAVYNLFLGIVCIAIFLFPAVLVWVFHQTILGLFYIPSFCLSILIYSIVKFKPKKSDYDTKDRDAAES